MQARCHSSILDATLGGSSARISAFHSRGDNRRRLNTARRNATSAGREAEADLPMISYSSSQMTGPPARSRQSRRRTSAIAAQLFSHRMSSSASTGKAATRIAARTPMGQLLPFRR